MSDEGVRAFTRGYMDGYADNLVPDQGKALVSPDLALALPLRKRQLHRRFYLYRQVDDTGVSGTGMVALGVQFPDGAVAIRWLGDNPSTVLWGHLEGAMAVHGHDGHTVPIWLDDDDAAERST